MPRRKNIAPPPGFSRADVLALTSATKSNVIHWTNLEIIKPAIEVPEGSTFKRYYSPLNIIEFQLAATVNAAPQVSVETIRYAVAAFSHFHRGAVAIHEHQMDAPISAQPSHLRFFQSAEQRRAAANRFLDFLFWPKRAQDLNESELQDARERARRIGEAWAQLRTGNVSRGIPDSYWRDRFLGLAIDEDGIASRPTPTVLLDPSPRELSDAIVSGRAVLINLVDVVFRVGEKGNRLQGKPPRGFYLGAW